MRGGGHWDEEWGSLVAIVPWIHTGSRGEVIPYKEGKAMGSAAMWPCGHAGGMELGTLAVNQSNDAVVSWHIYMRGAVLKHEAGSFSCMGHGAFSCRIRERLAWGPPSTWIHERHAWGPPSLCKSLRSSLSHPGCLVSLKFWSVKPIAIRPWLPGSSTVISK